jgi:hypothetical protein
LRIVAYWTHSSSTKSLVGKFTLLVKHTDKTFAVDFLKVRLGLSDLGSCVNALTFYRDLFDGNV